MANTNKHYGKYKVRMNVRISEKMDKHLRDIATKQGKSFAELVRELLEKA